MRIVGLRNMQVSHAQHAALRFGVKPSRRRRRPIDERCAESMQNRHSSQSTRVEPPRSDDVGTFTFIDTPPDRPMPPRTDQRKKNRKDAEANRRAQNLGNEAPNLGACERRERRGRIREKNRRDAEDAEANRRAQNLGNEAPNVGACERRERRGRIREKNRRDAEDAEANRRAQNLGNEASNVGEARRRGRRGRIRVRCPSAQYALNFCSSLGGSLF
jgi:hypothetical protein